MTMDLIQWVVIVLIILWLVLQRWALNKVGQRQIRSARAIAEHQHPVDTIVGLTGKPNLTWKKF